MPHCNTVVFKARDGKEAAYPLDFLLERNAIIASRVNGAPLEESFGSANQLWIPGLPARYYMRDIVAIDFVYREQPPAPPDPSDFVSDGHDYVNRPNVSVAAPFTGTVGEPMTFTGWASDYDKAITAVRYSLDGGEHWTTYDTQGTTPERWVSWSFTWKPPQAGHYSLRVQSVNEDGRVSPLPAVHDFDIY
jgi:hypothetical protein